MGGHIALCSGQTLSRKLGFGNSSYKTSKTRNQTFFFLASFTWFLYFVSNILTGIKVSLYMLMIFSKKILVKKTVMKKNKNFFYFFYSLLYSFLITLRRFNVKSRLLKQLLFIVFRNLLPLILSGSYVWFILWRKHLSTMNLFIEL